MHVSKIVSRLVSLLCVVVLFFSALAPALYAATEYFRIDTLVGNDTTAPTAPTALTATGVATTQIDLSWGTSTDNYALGGYHIWRDNVRIATTTATSYSDTGLTASTSYAYYVTAFDSFFNISASSSVATGTTLSPAPPSATTTDTESESGTVYGSKARALQKELVSLTVTPHTDSVILHFETANPVRSVVRWGNGDSYELGSLLEENFTRRHTITITGLHPDTDYVFTLEGENRFGTYGIMHQGSFTTLPPVDVFPPGNVQNLRAEQRGDDIVLTWNNPAEPDLAKIRVLQNDLFYPSDTVDGRILSEGLDEILVDTGRARVPGRYFYTVFSYDDTGNISSGAVISVEVTPDGLLRPVEGLEDASQNEIRLLFTDLQFIQDDRPLDLHDGSVTIDGTKPVTILLPYDRVPEHLKTIIVRIKKEDRPNESFAFLLRVNADKTAYTSVISPFGFRGTFTVVITVFDYKTAQVGYATGKLITQITEYSASLTSEKTYTFSDAPFRYIVRNGYLVLFILLLLALTLASKRLMRTEW